MRFVIGSPLAAVIGWFAIAGALAVGGWLIVSSVQLARENRRQEEQNLPWGVPRGVTRHWGDPS